MIVVDASIVVDFLTVPASTGRIRTILREHDDELHVPAHLDLEVASAVRRHVSTGALAVAEAGAVIADLADLSLHRHDPALLMPRIWSLRDHISPYDAAYIALAEGARRSAAHSGRPSRGGTGPPGRRQGRGLIRGASTYG